MIGGNRIPFARANGACAKASHRDMLTVTLGLLAFPLQMRLTAGRTFPLPLPLPGLVHIATAITVHRRIDVRSHLTGAIRRSVG